jgi:hypothetical protein
MRIWDWLLVAWVPVVAVLEAWWLVRWDRRGPPAAPPAIFRDQDTDEVGECGGAHRHQPE